MIQLIRLLGFETYFRAEAGDVRGALDEWIKGLRFIRLTLQESNLIEALVAIADARCLLAHLNQIVDGRSIAEEDLNRSSQWRTSRLGGPPWPEPGKASGSSKSRP